MSVNRRRFITLAVGAGGFLGLTGIPLKGLAQVERKSRALGADVSLVVYHENRAIAERALAAAFNALDDIILRMSSAFIVPKASSVVLIATVF